MSIRWLMAVGTVCSYVLVGAADPAMVDLLSVRTNRTTPDFDWYFAHGYDQTIKLLPSIDHRPAPDARSSWLSSSRCRTTLQG
jgi:hypothetical protein